MLYKFLNFLMNARVTPDASTTKDLAFWSGFSDEVSPVGEGAPRQSPPTTSVRRPELGFAFMKKVAATRLELLERAVHSVV